jgi:tetratricopeptide (TPR) repeat protein
LPLKFFIVKQPQWITLAVGVLLVGLIYKFGDIIPPKKKIAATENQQHSADDGHNHGSEITTDSILNMARRQLLQIRPSSQLRLDMLENAVSRGDVKGQKLEIFHQLAHFWRDSIGIFEPYVWYTAEAARLENSEKTLTFAAHLFLENLQMDRDPQLVRWKALQAKDLFERSLKINPDNDSSKVGLGACYMFGGISPTPMEGIGKIREVAERDSTNVYAQITLAKGAMMTGPGQYDKAISRLHTINRLQPDNAEAILMLADVYERKGNKAEAVNWYQKSLQFIKVPDARAEIEQRIKELKK